MNKTKHDVDCLIQVDVKGGKPSAVVDRLLAEANELLIELGKRNNSEMSINVLKVSVVPDTCETDGETLMSNGECPSCVQSKLLIKG